jgi:hypothetical protein
MIEGMDEVFSEAENPHESRHPGGRKRKRKWLK